jgi:hypothetical protein
MRFMMIVKADERTEKGVMPTEAELAEMAKYNEELVKAGVMLAGDGLQPSAKGVRIHFDGKQRKVVDGPFTEAKELIAGYWILQVKSREEAIEWGKRVPFSEGHIELRQLFELEDFGASEAIQHHERLRDELAKR